MTEKLNDGSLTALMNEIAPLADEAERQLRVRHPRLAGYLDMTIQARRLWNGGYEVLDEVYPTPEAAREAVKAAIMHKLIAADRCGHND